MLKEVIMPTLGLDMEAAVIERWLKQEGESVAREEPLLVVETDKATTEIVAPVGGILQRIVEPQGATVPVTRTIAFIETGERGAGGGERRAESGERRAESREQGAESGERGAGSPLLAEDGRGDGHPPETPRDPMRPAETPGEVRASPAARRVARDLGVDLSLVVGTGPGGRIQGEDVRRHAEESRLPSGPAGPVPPATPAEGPAESTPPPAPAPAEEPAFPAGLPGRLVPLGRKRRVTAERMALSSQTVARLTLNVDVDATELIRLRSRLLPAYEARDGVRLSYDALLAKMVATALVEHPYLNARWTDRGIYLVEPVNVGVAVAVEDGLVVAVVKDAARRPLYEVASELNRLLAKAREDRLTLEEMTGGTFTITNLGMFGVDSFIPIVNPPETAILGVGRVAERPVGREGQLVLRPMMTLSLSVDHRVVDGAPAARFLQRVTQLIEEPYLLI